MPTSIDLAPSDRHTSARKRCRGIPWDQSRCGVPLRVGGSFGILLERCRNLPVNDSTSTRMILQLSPLTPLSLYAYRGNRPHLSPVERSASYWSIVLPDRYCLGYLEDLTSIGKHMSPRRTSRSPVPSEPLPGALTTRNGRCITCMAQARSISLQDLVTARTPFNSPASTARNSRS